MKSDRNDVVRVVVTFEVPEEVARAIVRWHECHRMVLDARGAAADAARSADYFAAQIDAFAGRRLRMAYLAEVRRKAEERAHRQTSRPIDPADDPDRGP